MVFFMIIAAFQMLGMVAHRLMTFGHIVSSRNIIGKKKAFDMKKVIEQSGVSIMKDMIQNIEVNTMISFSYCFKKKSKGKFVIILDIAFLTSLRQS